MQKEEYPILEFDSDPNALIRPVQLFKPVDIAERCVICNFGEAIDKILLELPHRTVYSPFLVSSSLISEMRSR